MLVSTSRVFFVLVVVVSSTLALPIEIDGPGKYDRRNDFVLSNGKQQRNIGEAFKTTKRRNPFEYDDNDDLQHYLDENLDYVLLETLTNQVLEENGGDLDRSLTDVEYEEISERYFKELKGKDSTENANAWNTSPNRASPTRDNRPTRAEDRIKTPTDEGNTTPHQGGNTTPHQGGNTTPHQDDNTTPATHKDKWWTSAYWWTSPTYWDGTVFGLKTAWQDWKQTTARGTGSWQSQEHTKHFDWTGESKSGHQVHVVIYFDK